MQDMIPGLAPDPKMVLPFLSFGISERLRRPIFDHMLLGTLQTCIRIVQAHYRHDGNSIQLHQMSAAEKQAF